MNKIKNVAVTIENNIQFESFKNAIDIMLEQKINVDIFIPLDNNDDGYNRMFDEFYQKISKMNYNIFRELTKTKYDILFMPYLVYQFKDLKRKYTIRYLYGLTTKPEFFLSLETNYIFDGFLCYGKYDFECLKNYGIPFEIGNIKYINFKTNKKESNKKKTILYLPTYGNYSSIDTLAPMLIKLKDKYDILIKPHHGTEYGINEIEKQRFTYLRNNFENIYSSTYSLLELINICDIIITDQSGAVFDAICVKKPVIMYYNDTESNCSSLPVKYAKKGYFISINDVKNTNIENLISEAMDIKQLNKQNKLINILFCPQKEVKNNFMEFLKKIENGAINEDYYEIHQLQKEKISKLFETNQIINNRITNLNTELEEYKNKFLENSKKIDKITMNYNKLIEENSNLKQQISNLAQEYTDFKEQIYNSKSWKITKPLRYIKNVLFK